MYHLILRQPPGKKISPNHFSPKYTIAMRHKVECFRNWEDPVFYKEPVFHKWNFKSNSAEALKLLPHIFDPRLNIKKYIIL